MVTGRFANDEVVAFGNYTVHSKHKPVSGTGQASGLVGGRLCLLGSSCIHLQALAVASRFTDANLQRAHCLAKLFFSLSYHVVYFSINLTAHNHPPPLHLHLVTHYLDHLWSSTRLESLALSLHSFNFCTLIHICCNWTQVLRLLDPLQHSCALTF
jgi:hypothetical protein